MSSDDSPFTDPRLVRRLSALIEALRAGPLGRPELLARLGSAYPAGESARRMIDRDIRHLEALEVTVKTKGCSSFFTVRALYS